MRDCAGTQNLLLVLHASRCSRSLAQDAQHSMLLLFLLLNKKHKYEDDSVVMMKFVKLRSLPFSWDAYQDAPEGDYNHY